MYLFRPDLASRSAKPNRAMILINGGFNLAYDCTDFTPMVLTVHIRPERQEDLIQSEAFALFPEISYANYIDGFGNQCTRLIAPPGRLSIRNRFIIADTGLPEELPYNACQHSVPELPEESLIFLLGSRYCETQKLSEFAWSQFGGYQE